MTIFGKRYSNRLGKKLYQRILAELYAFIENTIIFDEDGKIEEGIDFFLYNIQQGCKLSIATKSKQYLRHKTATFLPRFS